MFWLWLIVAIVLFGAGIYRLGTMNEPESIKNDLFWMFLVVSIFWPIALALGILAGPFAGLYWLGNRKREKLKKEKSTDNK
jgi:chromate transport protein ChrA